MQTYLKLTFDGDHNFRTFIIYNQDRPSSRVSSERSTETASLRGCPDTGNRTGPLRSLYDTGIRGQCVRTSTSPQYTLGNVHQCQPVVYIGACTSVIVLVLARSIYWGTYSYLSFHSFYFLLWLVSGLSCVYTRRVSIDILTSSQIHIRTHILKDFIEKNSKEKSKEMCLQCKNIFN